MKKIYAMLLFLVIGSCSIFAQEVTTTPKKKFMQITTVESVVNGGMGRSKMLVTNADGTQKEIEMENLFSMVGINFNNIKENENLIVRTLRYCTDVGWQIDPLTPFALSRRANGDMGIFMSR